LTADRCVALMAQPLLGAAADACASFNLSAQSSQHTSTTLPPIVTSIALASSSLSQAAHVFAFVMMPSTESVHARTYAVEHLRNEDRFQDI
jgi:hypothetical protein